jgi:hypothetical protein
MRRWAAVVIATAAVAAAIGTGVSAMAAPGTEPGNYRGPARTAVTRPSVVSQQTNYRGPVRKPAQTAAVPSRHSNLPAQKGSN